MRVMIQPAQICMGCNQPSGPIAMELDEWVAWYEGKYIQDAAPSLSVNQREVLITGMHGPCFDAMAGPEE